MKIALKREIYLSELQDFFISENFDNSKSFTEISSVKDCSENSLSFYSINSNRVEKFLGVIISNDKNLDCESLIYSKNPKFDFAVVVNFLLSQKLINKEHETNIDSSSSIHKSAIIDEGVSIGANSIIEENAVIKSGTKIGKNCKIGAGSVLGSDGFGFTSNNDSKHVRFPHLGNVIVNDFVEIGSSTTVDRGSLENTFIDNYVKIDGQVHIGHGCTIGIGTLITAGTVLGGSVSIGENCFIGLKSSIRDNIKIGDNVFIGMGTNVISQIKKNSKVIGNPGRVID